MYHYIVHEEGSPPPHVSKGHAAPAIYTLGYRFGNISKNEMGLFRTADGLSGHANGRVQDVPAGLLGQGGGIINGQSRVSAEKTYSFFGDGELDEGSMGESFQVAGAEQLNVCYVIDHNGKNLTGKLKGKFENKIPDFESYGFEVIQVKNNVKELTEAYLKIKETDGPFALVVHSEKGEGISFMETHLNGYHGKTLDDENYIQAMAELGLAPTTFQKERRNIKISDEVERAVKNLNTQGYGLERRATREANTSLLKLYELS